MAACSLCLLPCPFLIWTDDKISGKDHKGYNDDIDWDYWRERGVFGQIKTLKYSESAGERDVQLNSMSTHYLQRGG